MTSNRAIPLDIIELRVLWLHSLISERDSQTGQGLPTGPFPTSRTSDDLHSSCPSPIVKI